jgi:hypothetical protein
LREEVWVSETELLGVSDELCGGENRWVEAGGWEVKIVRNRNGHFAGVKEGSFGIRDGPLLFFKARHGKNRPRRTIDNSEFGEGLKVTMIWRMKAWPHKYHMCLF